MHTSSKSQWLYFWAISLLMCLGKQQIVDHVLGPLHPRGALVSPSPNHSGHLGSEPADKSSLFLCLPLSLNFTFQINKQMNELKKSVPASFRFYDHSLYAQIHYCFPDPWKCWWEVTSAWLKKRATVGAHNPRCLPSCTRWKQSSNKPYFQCKWDLSSCGSRVRCSTLPAETRTTGPMRERATCMILTTGLYLRQAWCPPPERAAWRPSSYRLNIHFLRLANSGRLQLLQSGGRVSECSQGSPPPGYLRMWLFLELWRNKWGYII